MLYPHPQIYHHLKAIFVHVPKAAGTSIEQRLLEMERGSSRPFPGPPPAPNPKGSVGGHTTARAYRRRFPEEFGAYYKFAVVREPVDRFLSAFHYLRQKPVHPALNNDPAHDCATAEEFAARLSADAGLAAKIVHLMPQWEFVCDEEGTVLVDDVYRYEALEFGWAAICQRIGATYGPLPRLNPSRRPEPGDGTEEAGPATLAFVRQYYARDCEVFGYGI